MYVYRLICEVNICIYMHIHICICMCVCVLLNRGNHEDEVVGRAYGFFDEVSVCVYIYIG